MTPFDRLVVEVAAELRRQTGSDVDIRALADIVAAALKVLPRVQVVRDVVSDVATNAIDGFYCCAAQWGGCEGHDAISPRELGCDILDVLAELTRPPIGART